MSAQQTLVVVPRPVTMPRGSQWAARFAMWLLPQRRATSAIAQPDVPLASPYKRRTPTLLQAIGRSAWDAMAVSGQHRAARELREMAQRWESIDPAIAQQLREAGRYDTRS